MPDQVKQPARILVATYQAYPGDTDTPFLTPILTRLVERGHMLENYFRPGSPPDAAAGQ